MKRFLYLPVALPPVASPLATSLAVACLLFGCSKPAPMDAVMTKQPVFMKGAPTPFELQLKNGAEVAAGYAVKVTFSMSQMDHGSSEATLNETAPGTYAGVVALPMGGEWDVVINADKDGKTVEKTLTIKVNDGG